MDHVELFLHVFLEFATKSRVSILVNYHFIEQLVDLATLFLGLFVGVVFQSLLKWLQIIGHRHVYLLLSFLTVCFDKFELSRLLHELCISRWHVLAVQYILLELLLTHKRRSPLLNYFQNLLPNLAVAFLALHARGPLQINDWLMVSDEHLLFWIRRLELLATLQGNRCFIVHTRQLRVAQDVISSVQPRMTWL